MDQGCVKILENAAKTDRLGAFILEGTRSETVEAAKAAAKMFLCEYKFGLDCGRCMGCKLVDGWEHPFLGSGLFDEENAELIIIEDAEHLPLCEQRLLLEKLRDSGCGWNVILTTEQPGSLIPELSGVFQHIRFSPAHGCQ